MKAPTLSQFTITDALTTAVIFAATATYYLPITISYIRINTLPIKLILTSRLKPLISEGTVINKGKSICMLINLHI